MSNRTVAIIQARMGSTRFPGKMIAPFFGRPILSWVIARLQRSTLLNSVILATTNREHDHVLIDLAVEHGIQTFAGDEQNVLSRFVEAADITSADTVVRVCADNPLIAPEAIDQLIAFYQKHRPDYAYNHVPKGDCIHPDGFGAEILSADLLKSILQVASQPAHFEHVTSYIWDHPESFSIRCPSCRDEWRLNEDAQFDIDHESQLQQLEQSLAGVNIESTIEDILSLWENAKTKTLV